MARKLSHQQQTGHWFDAARHGQIVSLDALMAMGLDVNTTTNSGSGATALHIAASRGQQEAFEHLVSKGATANDPCGYMRMAVQCGCIDMIEWLREQPWHTKEADVAGLCAALLEKREPMLTEWIQDPTILNHIAPSTDNTASSFSEMSPLLCAAFHANSWTKPLLEKGADPNLVIDPTSGRSVLHLACGNLGLNPASLVDMITFGGNPNIEDIEGNTPLFMAARAGMVHTMRILAGLGARAGHRNSGGDTLLDVARTAALYGVKETSVDCARTLLAEWEAGQMQTDTPLAREVSRPRL